ncbi:MAG: alkaline phosphatase family protein [Leptospirales bacterium]
MSERFRQGFYALAKFVIVAFVWIVNAVCVIWFWLADFVCITWGNLRCGILSFHGGKHTTSGPIRHVFVLVLENRSFDHLLGFAGIHGMDAITGEPTHVDDLTKGGPYVNPDPATGDKPVQASSPADFFLFGKAPDPGHEFNNVLLQLCGYHRDQDGQTTVPSYPDASGRYPPINNSGFIASYFGLAQQSGVTPDQIDPERIMECFGSQPGDKTEQLPVLTTLAREFAVCDRWFSSLPGPTWPNRFFIHAASSGGLDDSPSAFESAESSLLNGYRFENGTIYDRLEDACLDWKVFMGDEFPQVFSISGMTDQRLEGHFQGFTEFADTINDPSFSTAYVLIEPDYGNILPTTPGDFTCGNSQHPLDDITRGEWLIKTVYETIRNSPHWDDSVLLVTYDEHGGFFDHVAPPSTVRPGDTITDENNNHHNFDFTQLGVRVPAIVISPLIPAGTIDHTTYDHTSLLATVEQMFGLKPLTDRDAHARTFNHLFKLATPRTDAPTSLPDPPDSGMECDNDTSPATPIKSNTITAQGASSRINEDDAIPPAQRSFLHVAFLRDFHRSSFLRKPAIIERFLGIRTRIHAEQYMDEVRSRMPIKRFRAGIKEKS